MGTIIGRQGRTIISLQKEASKSSLIHHVKVNVIEHNSNNDSSANDGTSSDWSRVLIRSDACGVFAAAKGVMKIMGDYEVVDPDVVLEVPLSRYKHGAVVGKKGCVIAGLSANHNVRIYVPPNSKHDPEGTASNANVQLEGELDNVEKCLVEMLAIVSGRIAGNNVPPVALHSRGSKSLLSKQQKNYDEALSSGADDGGMTGGDDKTSTPSTTTKSQNGKKKAGKEDGKNTDTLVIMAPENAVTPSLGQIRQIGKKTSTIIRRKRVPVNDASETAAAVEDDEEAEDIVIASPPEQDEGGKASPKMSNKKGNFATEFTITGRSTSLTTVQSFFDRFFAGEPVDSVLDSIASVKKSSGNGRSKKRGSKGNSGKGKGSSNRQQTESKSEDATGSSVQTPSD